MKFTSRLLTLLAAGAATVFASSAHAAGIDALQVRVEPLHSVLSGDGAVPVRVTLRNLSSHSVRLPRWQLPGGDPEASLFRVLHEGQPVMYLGKLVKRGPMQASDWVTIEAGATRTVEVDLASQYDMTQNGAYSVSLRGGALRSAESAALWLDGRSGYRAWMDAYEQASQAMAASISFTGACTSGEQSTLRTAVANATTYSVNAASYLNRTPTATQRYTKWFGALLSSRWSTVQSHFIKIRDAFQTKPLVLDCSCSGGYYAYVYANQPYKIYVCNAFWSAPMTGTDSKAGTLVHEMSHFYVTASTDDHAYGQSAAASLARSNPTRAVDNADSHEYFAENSPYLP